MESIIPRFFTSPKGSFFLFGPCGTGKSTLLRHMWQKAIWVDLLQLDLVRSYQARPERLRELVAAYSRAVVVVIDEIPKAPDLLSVVHSLIEKKRNARFIPTGSSVRKIKRADVDLLADRTKKLQWVICHTEGYLTHFFALFLTEIANEIRNPADKFNKS